MRAGILNSRGVIQQRVNTADDTGGATVQWQDVATVWLRVAPGEGREFWAIQHSQPLATHEITIRYRTDVTAQMRVKVNGAIYRIVAPPRDAKDARDMLVLTCEQHTAGA